MRLSGFSQSSVKIQPAMLFYLVVFCLVNFRYTNRHHMLCNTVTKIEATIQNDVTHPNMADRKEKKTRGRLICNFKASVTSIFHFLKNVQNHFHRRFSFWMQLLHRLFESSQISITQQTNKKELTNVTGKLQNSGGGGEFPVVTQSLISPLPPTMKGIFFFKNITVCCLSLSYIKPFFYRLSCCWSSLF